MSGGRRYQVKDLSQAAGVSIRTLHHYDAIGLLVPSARTAAGYRVYTDDDALRLQQILIGRELGLALEEIRRMLDDPGHDRREALRRQRAELVQRQDRTARMLRAVEAAIAALPQQEEEMDVKEIFDGFDPARYEAEAEERWGKTDAYRESARRTRGYSAEDWKRYRDESETILREAAAAREAGGKPSDSGAMDVAERHRLLIDRWFYPCSPSMHAALADMYEADARFAASIDGHGAGLTPFLAAAIRANAQRGGGAAL
jgi:DNA-binding transcriptional MerR regulator